MGLSKLAAMCQKCSKVDTCDHKRMEAVGCIPVYAQPEPDIEQISQPNAMLNGVDQSYIIKTNPEHKDIVEKIKKELYKSLMCPFEIRSDGGNTYGT